MPLKLSTPNHCTTKKVQATWKELKCNCRTKKSEIIRLKGWKSFKPVQRKLVWGLIYIWKVSDHKDTTEKRAISVWLGHLELVRGRQKSLSWKHCTAADFWPEDRGSEFTNPEVSGNQNSFSRWKWAKILKCCTKQTFLGSDTEQF